MDLAKSNKIKKIVLITLHVLVFLSALWGILAAVFNVLDCDHDHWNEGWKVFKFFTNDSNLFAAGTSLAIAIFHIVHFKDDKKLPAVLSTLHLIAVSMLMMVLLTVLATMVSSMTWRVLFGFPSFLFLHTVTPLLSLGLFLFTDRAILRKRAIVWADLPYLIYATSWVIVLLILNLPPEVEARRDVSPYFFLSIHNQPWYISLAWFVGLLLTQTALAAILLLLKNRPWSTKKRLQNNQNA